ncbi:MAG: ATP-binding protein [Anaerolineae bacterium]|jgi:PAS domain S-box-containing protein
MEPDTRERIAAMLLARRDTLVGDLYTAALRSSYVALSREEMHRRLAASVDRAIELLLAETVDPDGARALGQQLVGLHFRNADMLDQVLALLGHRLVEGLPAEMLSALQPRLAWLQRGLAAGYFEHASQTILSEQEEMRSALVNKLHAAQSRLRQARDELDARVEQRTAELARANEELREEIAERHRVEQALRESEERWRTLVENAPDRVATVDRHGIIRFLNRISEDANLTMDQVLGSRIETHVVPEDRAAVREALRQVFELGSTASYEVALPTSKGDLVWHAARLAPLWEDGQVVSALLIVRDISHRKRLEQMKDNLIRDVSHELRTPLAKVHMGLDLLSEVIEQEPIDQARATRVCEMASRNVERLLHTLEAMLDLSRLEAGMWRFRHDSVDVCELVDEVLSFVAPLAKIKGLDLEASCSPDVSELTGDRDKLFQVVLNLVENAIKFSDKGRVSVSAQVQDGLVELAVSDEGEGIDPENLDRIFERFFQEKVRSEGVGIGLTISQAIVEAHQGRIWAVSEGRGQGSTFHVALPLSLEGSSP